MSGNLDASWVSVASEHATRSGGPQPTSDHCPNTSGKRQVPLSPLRRLIRAVNAARAIKAAIHFFRQGTLLPELDQWLWKLLERSESQLSSFLKLHTKPNPAQKADLFQLLLLVMMNASVDSNVMERQRVVGSGRISRATDSDKKKIGIYELENLTGHDAMDWSPWEWLITDVLVVCESGFSSL